MSERYDGPIIDAHHHVWDLERNSYPWLEPGARVPHRYGDYSAIKHTYLPGDYRRDIQGTGVVASVYMEAEWDDTDPIGETRYVSELSASSGVPGAMAAQAWLDAPDVARVLAEQASFPLVKSVRHKPGDTLMRDEAWRAGYALLAEHGLHFELQTPWQNLDAAADLARNFPDTLLIVNHSGVLLDRRPETVAGWRDAMARMAALPNVVVKASGLGVEGQPWTTDLNRDVVFELVSLFGADRLMFGSNFPVDGLFARYDQLLDSYIDITAPLTAAEKRAFFYGTADRVYQPLPFEAP
jgi:predicted TIM-barrel fold metal-dependent hydrolase